MPNPILPYTANYHTSTLSNLPPFFLSPSLPSSLRSSLSGGERQRAAIGCALLLSGAGCESNQGAAEASEGGYEGDYEGVREGVYEGIGESERDKPGVVLLLDEPTAACDPATAKLVERAIVKSGVTVIWVTHDHAQTLRMAHKRLVLTLAHPTNTTTVMTTSTKSITSVAAAATSSSSSSVTLSGSPTIKHPSLPVPATTTTTTTTTMGLTEEKTTTTTSNSNAATMQSASTIATNSAIASSASSTTTIDEKNKSTIPTDATNSSTATTTLSEQQPNQSTQIQSSQPPQPPRRRFIQTYNRVELTFATHPPPLSKAYWGPIDASTFRVRGPTYLQGNVSHRQSYSQHTLSTQTLTNPSHHPLSTPLPPPI